jgi:hypothetical protein
MRWLVACVLMTFVAGCGHSTAPKIPKTSMRVVEYKEITGSIPGPTLHVWMVVDDKRDLCFAVFNSGDSSVAPVKIDCAGVKPQPERGCP